MRVSIVQLQLGEATSTAIEVVADGENFTLMDSNGKELTLPIKKLVDDLIREVKKEYGSDRANQ